MFSTCVKASLCASIFGVMLCNAQAATIWLEPASQPLVRSGIMPVELWADASDVGGFLAGGLDLFYDESIVVYNGDFSFDAAFDTDPDFSRTGDNCSIDITASGCSVPGEINGIAFGSFDGVAADGPVLVGTMTFLGSDVFNLGPATLTMTDNDVPAGAWFATNGSGPLIVDYIGADMRLPEIPVPAAMWLMVSGIVPLLGFARKTRMS